MSHTLRRRRRRKGKTEEAEEEEPNPGDPPKHPEHPPALIDHDRERPRYSSHDSLVSLPPRPDSVDVCGPSPGTSTASSGEGPRVSSPTVEFGSRTLSSVSGTTWLKCVRTILRVGNTCSSVSVFVVGKSGMLDFFSAFGLK